MNSDGKGTWAPGCPAVGLEAGRRAERGFPTGRFSGAAGRPARVSESLKGNVRQDGRVSKT